MVESLFYTLLLLPSEQSTNAENDSKFLWFNKAVKQQNQPMFVGRFCTAGILDFFSCLNRTTNDIHTIR